MFEATIGEIVFIEYFVGISEWKLSTGSEHMFSMTSSLNVIMYGLFAHKILSLVLNIYSTI